MTDTVGPKLLAMHQAGASWEQIARTFGRSRQWAVAMVRTVSDPKRHAPEPGAVQTRAMVSTQNRRHLQALLDAEPQERRWAMVQMFGDGLERVGVKV